VIIITTSKSVKKQSDLSRNTLSFKKTYFSYLSTFFLKNDTNTTREYVIKKLREKKMNADWKKPHSEQFKIAEDFLLPVELCKKRFRLKIDDFTIYFKPSTKIKVLEKPTKVEVFLTIYNELNIGILMFNVKLEKFTSDDLIYVRQCFDGSLRFQTDLPSFIELQKSNYLTIKEIIGCYINSINKAFNSEIKAEKTLYTKLFEISSPSGFKTNTPDDIVKNFPKQVYGLLTGDEGWRFVPKKRAELITSKNWATRDFLLVLSFHHCVLLFNFTGSTKYKNYVKSCEELRKLYNRPVENYFTFLPEIAGLNHGPLLILENASVERFLLNDILEPEANIKYIRINSFLKERDEIIDTLNKLSFIEIKEISDISMMIKERMMILNDIKKAEDKLKLFEGEILIQYNQRINRLIVILTVLGIIVATFSLMNL